MRIYHGPSNISGMAGILACAQRELGARAVSYCYPTPPFHYYSDFTVGTSALDRLGQCLTQPWRFDCFHFYFGDSLSGPALWDIPWLKRIGKKVFFHFCGCDVRDSKHTIRTYQYSACKNCWPMACSANRKQAIEAARLYADRSFVSTPDLLEFVPGSVWLPSPVGPERLTPPHRPTPEHARESAELITIAHAPSNRMRKGTMFLEQAVERLRRAGYPVRLRLVEKKSNEEALRLCAGADLVVDQLLIGSYGQYSIEMMALGKPVLCYIRDDLRRYYPANLPIISANPGTIEAVLKEMIERRRDWPDLGRQGIDYVSRVHDSRVVARATLRIYEGQREFAAA